MMHFGKPCGALAMLTTGTLPLNTVLQEAMTRRLTLSRFSSSNLNLRSLLPTLRSQPGP